VETELRELLEKRQKIRITDTGRIASAVLIPIYKDKGIYHIVFIKRTETVSTHKGQISFPGGAREKEDISLRETALRESYEEIGLATRDVEVLGELDDEITFSSNYIVTPYIGMIPWPYEFMKNTSEVDEILTIPIPALLKRDHLHPNTEKLNGRKVDLYEYHYRGKVIWGATACILKKLLDIISLT
jgi:8-oxo-dGTP pyrophosphatase MutT (NUDIX family)